MKLFVKGLDESINEAILEGVFAQYGEVTSAKVIYDKITWESRGFGFVEFEKKEDALKAIEAMNGKELKGHVLEVKEAEERKRF
ncbi:MAG TPA: RNA-binding protein [Bacteroidia bacterium]|jgi:RNA recognition motif-containing protein